MFGKNYQVFVIQDLTLVLWREVETTSLTVFAPVLKNVQPRDKIAPGTLSSSFPLVLGIG